MRSKTLMLLSAATLTLTACGRDNERSTTQADNFDFENIVVANDAMPATATNAQAFANAAAASDRFEIESSKLATSGGQSAVVKNFATNMIKAQTASSAKLKTTVASLATPWTIDDALNPDQQRLLDGLNGKSGAALDAAYTAAQISAHQSTLDALNAYAASGDNPTLKQLATEMIPTVTAHLNTAKGLK